MALTAAGLAAAGLAGCGGGRGGLPARSTQTSLVPVSVELQHAIAEVWPHSADIWPGTELKDRRVILADGRSTRLVGVDGVDQVSPSELAKRQVEVPPTGSALVTWDRRPAVVLNMADPAFAEDARDSRLSLANTLFRAATDELFHAAQQDWKALKSAREIRGTDYPLAVTPRLYRAMVYNDLVNAYRDPGKRGAYLASAAYWNAEWKKEYGGEAGRAVTTDIGEGAAGYFDTVALAMAAGITRGDRDELRKNAPFRPLGGTLDPADITLDGEGSALGGIAGLLLDETGHKGWKRQLANGRATPVDLLLNGVRPVAGKPSEPLRQSIQEVLAKQNSDLIPRLDPLVSAFHDTGRSLLLIPLNSAEGDLDAGGYYVARNVPFALLPRLNGVFRLASGTLQANDASVLAGAIGGHSYLIVPVDTSDAKSRVSSNRIRLRGRSLTGEVAVVPRTDHGRRELIAH